MSVYINGLGMPQNCCECFAFKSNAIGYLFCKAKKVAFGKEDAKWLPKTTPNWCPLIAVPDHGRLIDADALEYHADNVRDPMGRTEKTVMWKKIEAAPTVIPADKENAK